MTQVVMVPAILAVVKNDDAEAIARIEAALPGPLDTVKLCRWLTGHRSRAPASRFAYPAGMRTLFVAFATIPLFACPEPQAQYCAQLQTEAQSGAVPTAAEVSCQADSDCVLVSNGTGCGSGEDGCYVAISDAGATAFNAALAQVKASTCVTYFNSGCKPVPPSLCIPADMERAYCTAGRCVIGSVPPPSDDAGVDAADSSFDAASE